MIETRQLNGVSYWSEIAVEPISIEPSLYHGVKATFQKLFSSTPVRSSSFTYSDSSLLQEVWFSQLLAGGLFPTRSWNGFLVLVLSRKLKNEESSRSSCSDVRTEYCTKERHTYGYQVGAQLACIWMTEKWYCSIWRGIVWWVQILPFHYSHRSLQVKFKYIYFVGRFTYTISRLEDAVWSVRCTVHSTCLPGTRHLLCHAGSIEQHAIWAVQYDLKAHITHHTAHSISIIISIIIIISISMRAGTYESISR